MMARTLACYVVIFFSVTILLNATCPLTVSAQSTESSLVFTQNLGQWDDQVQFRTTADGVTMWLTESGMFYQFSRLLPAGTPPEYGVRPDSVEHLIIRTVLAGANTGVPVAGREEVDYRCNYFLGGDPGVWRTDVPNFRQVEYSEIYPGIDLRFYGDQSRMEYDFVIGPGVDPGVIQVRYEGANSLSINEAGQLVVETDWGVVTEAKPAVYQVIDGETIPVIGSYVLVSPNTFGFMIDDSYDVDLPVVIDPVLSYSSYLGGDDGEKATSVAIDESGNMYLAGYTASSDFPTIDSIQGVNAGAQDVFVSKLNAQGDALVFSTYIGGQYYDQAMGIAVDNSGIVYLTGWTNSDDFPTANAYDDSLDGTFDGFVIRLNADGNQLVYSTYLGGSGNEWGADIAVDTDGQAYVIGVSGSSDFPTVSAFDGSRGGSQDVYVTKFNAAGDGLVFSTYLGGTETEHAGSIAVGPDGSAFVVGWTNSISFPRENPIQSSHGGNGFDWDGFVTKFAPTGSSLDYGTYMGGSGDDYLTDIAVGPDGSASIAGYSTAENFPVANAFQDTTNGDADMVVLRLTAEGDSLIFSTYLGGTAEDAAAGVAVDFWNNTYVTGKTLSDDFPVLNAYQDTRAGDYDAVVTELDSLGSAIIYSTYLGGLAADQGQDIHAHIFGNVYVSGYTDSDDFPTVNPYMTDQAGSDGFIAVIDHICVDTDADGYGDPGNPTNECTDDNCPSIYNPNQADNDLDGQGDLCDDDDDDDGTADTIDNCPFTYNPGQENNDGDAWGDVCDDDDDDDGVADTLDNCPFVSNPLQENNDGDAWGDVCDDDDDDDGIADTLDNCPFADNPLQENNDGDAWGDVCDDDDDDDGVLDGADNCQFVSNPLQENNDGDAWGDICDDDDDDDGVADTLDNCPFVDNPLQENNDGDAWGDVCDDDDDDDTVADSVDNCPFTSNLNQDDDDSDGLGDVCDNCPNDYNPGQEDYDLDGIGDICDGDDDDDGVDDTLDICPMNYNPIQEDADSDLVGDSCDNCILAYNPLQEDLDGDLVGDSCDNCPEDYNPGQEDGDGDTIGDVCDECCGRYTGGYTGNCDCDAGGKRNLSDISKLIDRVYLTKLPLCCEGNGNTDGDVEFKINLADISKLIDHVYVSKAQTAACP